MAPGFTVVLYDTVLLALSLSRERDIPLPTGTT